MVNLFIFYFLSFYSKHMKYNRFEDLPVWQQARAYMKKAYGLIKSNHDFAKDFSLVDQFKRAVLSIMLNIAEGFERGGNKELSNFVNIAKGSAGEVRSILYVLLDNQYITAQDFENAKKEIEEISAALSNFRNYLVKNLSYKKFSSVRG